MRFPVLLDPYARMNRFPPVTRALTEPNGLLAIGGCLDPDWLIEAYRDGIFPWFSPGQPILWWSPEPRMVLFPERLKVSRSLEKLIRQGVYTVTLDPGRWQNARPPPPAPVRRRRARRCDGFR